MNSSNIIFMTTSKATAEKQQQVHQAMADVAAAARKQPGCVDYRIFRTEDGSTINYEQWESNEARDAFNAGPDVQKFIDAVMGNFAVAPEPISYQQIS